MPEKPIKTVTANISISIEGATAESILNAETNDCINGGKTSFTRGDTWKYLVFKSADVTITDQFATYGQASGPISQIALPQTETVTFSTPKETTAALGKPADGGFSATWLGAHTADGLALSVNKSNVTVSTAGFGVAKVSYTTNAYIHQLTIPADLPQDVTEIQIFILGRAPDNESQQCPSM